MSVDLTLKLGLIKARAARTPILVDPPALPCPSRTIKTLSTGYVFRRLLGFPFPLLTFFSRSAHTILPHDLASDIRQFVESDFAQQYFATHRTGFIFKRKVPVGQMMTWQCGPLAAPLFNLARPLTRMLCARSAPFNGSWAMARKAPGLPQIHLGSRRHVGCLG